MTENIFAFDFNGVKVLRDSGTKLKRLRQTVAGVLTLHDSEDDSNYQVPAGKKFTVIFIESSALSGGSDRLISSDTLDSTSDEIVLLQPSSTLTNVVFLSTEVAENRYITVVDGSGPNLILYGVEEDA